MSTMRPGGTHGCLDAVRRGDLLRLVVPIAIRSKANTSVVIEGVRERRPAWVAIFEHAVHYDGIRLVRAAGFKSLPAFPGRVAMSYWLYFERDPTNRDLDNALKSINDALEGVLYERDSQIWCYDHVEKFHDPEQPRIEVAARSLEPW